MNGNSRYFDTGKMDFEGFPRGQPFRVHCCEVDHQPDRCLGNVLATADAEPPNLDQPGQVAGRPDPTFFAICIQMDTVVADQKDGWKLPAAAGQDEVEGEAGLARS